jgi:hypothetical protein
MHINLSLLDIIFHGTIFSILLWNITLLIRKYLIPVLHQEACDTKNYQMEIIQKDKLLISTQSRLEKQIKQQQKNFLILDKHLQQWHRAHREEKDGRDQAIRKLQEKIQSKRFIQQHYIQTSTLLLQSIDDALQQASTELLAQCSLDNHHTFTQKSIDLLDLVTLKGISDDSRS